MRILPSYIVSSLTLAITTGCISPFGRVDADKLIKAMSQNHSSYHAQIPTPAGMVNIWRTNPGSNTLDHAITQDGSITVGPSYKK